MANTIAESPAVSVPVAIPDEFKGETSTAGERLPERGPVYGVNLILDPQPIGNGMFQEFPGRKDLIQAQQANERTVAAYEYMTAMYRKQVFRINELDLVVRAYEAAVTRLSQCDVNDREQIMSDLQYSLASIKHQEKPQG